jgi:hypothetical protein
MYLHEVAAQRIDARFIGRGSEGIEKVQIFADVNEERRDWVRTEERLRQ